MQTKHPSINLPPRESSEDAPLFGGMASAADLDRIEGGTAPATGRPAYFEGRVDKALNLSLTNPHDTVECFVRPGRGASIGIPELDAQGLPTRIKLSRAQFEGNRGSLATHQEISRILHQQRQPRAHEVTRELQKMREARITETLKAQTPEEQSRIEAARAKHRAEEGEGAQLAQRVAKEAEARHPETRDTLTRLLRLSAAERSARVEEMRKQARDLAATMGTRGADTVLASVEAEIAELEREWAAQAEKDFAALQNTGPAAARRWDKEAAARIVSNLEALNEQRGVTEGTIEAVEERLRGLQELHAKGAISAEALAQRQAAILAEAGL